ncbi:hypothetical protein [Deinococcus peraridilitoris]|uniref:Uncharacterized protein n=1 Tax=Deinococcus peraridilitoris (strain DSM 19664 / LMG 22246 / CIP 109416 / KR-200) TaxID=937777 RepID=L0A3L4_DEIPD|nr:hypothetical protein [Deinococcus peraridilitoris]AFZ67772.1 hypothetical protein Deipe_2291 [Deinococcus peraridilitoris DSM 19664]
MLGVALNIAGKVGLVIGGLFALAALVLFAVLAWGHWTTRPQEVQAAVWRPPTANTALPDLRLIGVAWTTIARQEVVLACGAREPREVRKAYWMGPDEWADHEEVRVEWFGDRVTLYPPERLERIPNVDSVTFDEADFVQLRGCG